MACPHSSAPGSTPEKCSQCVMAKARIVRYDPDTRALLIDDELVERAPTAEVKSPPNRGTMMRGGRRAITCGICGGPHTRLSCGKN